MTHKVLGNLSKGKLFILSAPAGTGKTTLARMASSEFSCVVESVSYTTRKPRGPEIEGHDYFFVSKETFVDLIDKGEFLEHALVFGNYYGTSKKFVHDHLNNGQHVLLVIDVQGAMALKKQNLDACFIFIKPPSLVALKQRLLARNCDSQEAIDLRLSQAQHEMTFENQYDYQIINDNLLSAFEVLKSILIAEEHKIRRK
jgi:guanylate kinase